MHPTDGYFYLFTLLVGVALGILFMQPAEVVYREPAGPDIGPGADQRIVIDSNVSSPLPAIFDASQDSVVSVRTESNQGSGFVFDDRGYIVTNEHVVEDAGDVEVSFPTGAQRDARIVGIDPYTDLAVLKIDPEGATLRPLPLGNVSGMRVGEQVAAIGNPFGLSGTMTSGILSQKDRLLQVEGQFSVPGTLQTDAAINPGNSGGPLLNMDGEVIGVNTAISSRTGTFNGVGFAVSVDTVKRVIPTLIREGAYEHPWIGVSGIDVDPDISDVMNLDVTSGFLVVSVVDDSPADEAGLRGATRNASIDGSQVAVGGDVIVAIDGNQVRQIDDILNHLAQRTSVGETVTLTLIRDGERQDIDVTLAQRPDPR